MQVILDSSFARPGSAPIWGGKKGESRDWTSAEIDRLRTIKKNNEPGEGSVDWICRVKRSWGARARAG